MARFNLNENERRILTSWLFEPSGYLERAVLSATGQTAREAGLPDVAAWVRANGLGAFERRDIADECAMVWWIRANDGVNVTPPTAPPEATRWVSILQAWGLSIDNAFVRVSSVARNANTVPITTEAGALSTMPAGTHLIHQRSLIDKVLGVL